MLLLAPGYLGPSLILYMQAMPAQRVPKKSGMIFLKHTIRLMDLLSLIFIRRSIYLLKVDCPYLITLTNLSLIGKNLMA